MIIAFNGTNIILTSSIVELADFASQLLCQWNPEIQTEPPPGIVLIKKGNPKDPLSEKIYSP
jgi:hypothetical protein